MGRRRFNQTAVDRPGVAAGNRSLAMAGTRAALSVRAPATCGWIRNYMAMSSTNFATGTVINAQLNQLFSGSMPLAGLVLAGVSILQAGHEAMTVPRTQVKCLAGAHAYASWLFSHRNLPRPTNTPQSLVEVQEAEDQRGNHDLISAEEYAQIWRTEVNASITRFNSIYQATNVDHIRSELVRRMPNATVHRQSPVECRNLLKLMVAADFDHDPSVAGSAYLLWRIKDKSDMEQRVLTIRYRNHPYSA